MIEKLIYDVITKFLMEGCLTTYIVIIGYLAPLLLTAEISKSKKAHQFLVVYWIVLLISEQFFLKVYGGMLRDTPYWNWGLIFRAILIYKLQVSKFNLCRELSKIVANWNHPKED